MDMTAKLVLEEFMELGEGPCWDEEEQALYWVDTDLKRVHKYCPYSGEKKTYQLNQKVGSAVKETAQTLICALENGFYRLNQADGAQKFLLTPKEHRSENIFNDGKCDKAGNFWAGTVHIDELENRGLLYCLKSDMECEVKVRDITISNGIAWTEDYKTMYYIDTPTMQVAAFDYDIDACTVSNKRIVIEFSPDDGMPDGMTIDEEGNLWVAMWGGYSVCKCDPRNGRIMGKVKVPAANVTSCIFGGKDLDTLYITTAMAELTPREREKQPLAGGVFQLKTDTKGFPSNRFATDFLRNVK